MVMLKFKISQGDANKFDKENRDFNVAHMLI